MPDGDIFDKAAAASAKSDVFDQAATLGMSKEQQTLAMLPQRAPVPLPQGLQSAPAGTPAELSQRVGRDVPLQNPGGGVYDINSPFMMSPSQAKQAVKADITGLGGFAGGEALAEGGPVSALSNIIRALGSGAGAATGNVAGSLATGQKPSATEAMKTGALFTGSELAGMAAGAIGKPIIKQAAKLFGESPERLAALEALPKQEEAIRQRVVLAEQTARKAASAMYPKIEAAPVNVAGARSVANQVAEQLIGPTPKAITQVANIPGPAAMKLPEGLVTEDVANVLNRIRTSDNITFGEAQDYRSMLEQAISRGRGRLPGNIYHSLKSVSNALDSAMRQTADNEGVLSQFDSAQKAWQQYKNDFTNPGAPLAGVLKAKEGQTGVTLRQFMNTANRARATQALERYGFSTADIKSILSNPAVTKNIKDAAVLQQLGPGPINQAAASAAKGKVLRYAGKAAPYGGGIVLEEILRRALSRGAH